MAYSTPRKPGVFTSYRGSPTRVAPKKGLFIEGVWHCNCDPRLPASHFQVRKEGPNKGRWFYTCQQPKDAGCGFFLWDEDAKGREMGVVLDNSTSEQATPITPRKQAYNKQGGGAPKPYDQSHGQHRAVSETKADSADDFDDWALSAQDENEMVQQIDRQMSMPPPETPKKVIKTAVFTPGSKRRREDVDVWPTPSTMSSNRLRDEDIFTTPSTSRFTLNSSSGTPTPARRGIPSPSASPTPTPIRQPNFGYSLNSNISTSTDPFTGALGSSDYDITDSVLSLLATHSLPTSTITDLRTLLNKHALRTSGIEKGRDITREALKVKERDIEELKGRIVKLEAERELDKCIIRHFKRDVSESMSRRGRGRGRGS